MKPIEWTPTAPILPPGKRPGQRVVGVNEDGDSIAVPHTQYEVWIDPAGNVINLPVKTTRAPGQDTGSYMYEIRGLKAKAGWLPYNFDHGVHPSRPSKTRGKPNPWLSAFAWEADREGEIELRRAAHLKQSEKYNKAWRAQDEAQALRTEESMAKAME